MTNLWILVKNNLRITVTKKPISFLMVLLVPVVVLVLCCKFVTYSATYINVGLVDEDQTFTSKIVIDMLKSVDGVDTFDYSKDEIIPNFKNNTINVAVEISKGFEQKLRDGKIEDILVYANDGSNDRLLISALLKNHLLNFRNLGRISQGDEQVYKDSITTYMENTSIVSKASLNDLYTDYNNSNLFIGFLILMLFFKAASVANTINVDKENNIYTRIFVSNVKTWQYYGANVICNLFIAMLQIGIAVLAMQYVVDVSIGIQTFVLFVILSIIAAIAVSFGTFCVALTKDADTASMMSNMFNLIFVILGGSFIQVEYFPDIVNVISYLSPARWATSCMMSLQAGATFAQIIPRILVMFAMAAVFLIVAFRVTYKRDKNFNATRS